LYDFLDDKIKVFLNIYYFNKVDPSQFYTLLPRILTSRAKKYYLIYININNSFTQVYAKLKTHFDTNTNHQQYFNN
jgi:hypothetical protein